MRWIHCDCCKKGKANAVVWNDVKICHDCKMAVINYWMGVLGFTLAPHPFIDEFLGVETVRERNRRLESYVSADQLSLFSSESDLPVDNSLDILNDL